MSRTAARLVVANIMVVLTGACVTVEGVPPPVAEPEEYYGTLEPFAAEAVYFLMTDRFVDGDPGNNYEDQGGVERGTFDRPIKLAGLPPGNIGYLGGDFKGVVDNADYIAGMGFTAVWITPIVDNPNEAFTGGIRPGEGFGADRGKTGYHGYWGVNFFVEDEHLVSPGLDFGAFTEALGDAGLKTVLDVVCNHGSPAYTMPEDQPMYGELYDAGGRLVADHQNLHPNDLDPENPLHAFYRREPDLAQLSDMDWENPEVLEYFVAAYLQWIDQGAHAFRIDTIKHMPHAFWKSFSDRIREVHPGYFMFAEAYSFDAAEIAEFTHPDNGGISVLDFPGKSAMASVFADGEAYSVLKDYLHLDTGVYENPYDLMTFYDNHDMARIDADESGFIDVHNWLFTSRGIPVIYYGSEIGFRAGTDQHSGNRDYFGIDNLQRAKGHPVYEALQGIATLRRSLVSLQRGLQVNIEFTDDTAVFLRIYQEGGRSEQALVMLNKSDVPQTVLAGRWLTPGDWWDAQKDETFGVTDSIELEVPAHGVRVLITDRPVNNPELRQELKRLLRHAAAGIADHQPRRH
jgi:cyclomaltodextrin glucanotransferase